MDCGHGRSWRATVAKPARREVLLRVNKCLRGAMGDTADLGSVAIWYEGSSPFAGKIMVQWCNWETRQVEVLMPKGLAVRLCSEPDFVQVAKLENAVASKAAVL